MVGVAQLVEHFAVAEVVGSSNLLAHPTRGWNLIHYFLSIYNKDIAVLKSSF